MTQPALVTPLVLKEYETLAGVRLSAEERSLLRGLAPSIDIRLTDGSEGLYDLTPSSFVGAINLGSISLEIRPKVPLDRLLFLISYALDPSSWHSTEFDLQPESSLVEAVIPAFIHHIGNAFRRGLLQGYRTEEEALATVRGRIRFDDQIRKRFGIFPPIEVRFDEFTEDIEENRLIRAAIERLGRLRLRSYSSRTTLRRFAAALAPVSLVEYEPRNLPEIHYTRLNERYRNAVELAKLILASSSLEFRHGDVRGTSFLVNMNKVFENFVVAALREALGLNERTFPQGALKKGLRLDQTGRITLEPDISWWDGPLCTFVGDVKYKKVSAEGIKNPDIYQLLAYAIATNLPGGLLIYAEGEAEPNTHFVRYGDQELEVVTLDLSKSSEEILHRIQWVAQRVRLLHEAARRAATQGSKVVHIASASLTLEAQQDARGQSKLGR